MLPLFYFHPPWEVVGFCEASLPKVRSVQALTPYIPTSLGTCKEKREIANRSDTTDLDLNKNTTNYRDNHKQKDGAEIILHLINVKY